MSLDDLHKNLYNKDQDEKRKSKSDYFGYGDYGGKKEEPNKKVPADEKSKDLGDNEIQANAKKEDELAGTKSRKKKIFMIVGFFILAFMLVGLGAIFYDKYRESAFNPERVNIEIIGPEALEGGKRAEFKVIIKNDNKIALINAELKIKYSEELSLQGNEYATDSENNIIQIKIEQLNKRATQELDLEFEVFGAKDVQAFFEAGMEYQPKGFSSSFESQARKNIAILAPSLDVVISTTKEASNGELVQAEVVLENTGKESFEKLEFKITYPEGFIFKESDPAVDLNDNIWNIEEIKPNQQIKFLIKGEISGSANSIKKFIASVEDKNSNNKFKIINEAESVTKIVSSRIELIQTINGKTDLKVISAGETLEFKIKFKNTSEEPLGDLILSEKIDSLVIDENSFTIKNGFYNEKEKQIVWKASDLPILKNLNSNQEGEVSFTVRVKEKLPAENRKDKNFTISTQPVIESLNIDSPLGENKMVKGESSVLKVKSKLLVQVSGSYNDGEISNSGPIPMEVGTETTFTLRFNILNTSNDLKDAKIYATFPSNVVWKKSYLPNSSSVKYNERTNEFTWELGTIQAGTGFFLSKKELAFQIGITLSQYQTDSSSDALPLFNQLKATAFDTFAGEEVEYVFSDFSLSEVSDY